MGGHKSKFPPIKMRVMLAQILQMQHFLSALTPRCSSKLLVLELPLRGKIILASIQCILKMRGDVGHCRKLKQSEDRSALICVYIQKTQIRFENCFVSVCEIF